jgi:transposase
LEVENYTYFVIKQTIMPQVQLPIFPSGVKYINANIGVKTQEDIVYYFNGSMPIYKHHKDDYKSFRFITSQMIELGNARQVEVKAAFEVSIESVKRWTKVYREKGADGFFGKKIVTRKGRVLFDQVIIDAQGMLNALKTPKEIEEELGVKRDTLLKAIRDGRLLRPEGKLPEPEEEQSSLGRQASSKSSRSIADSEAPMGIATTNTVGRIAAAIKKK